MERELLEKYVDVTAAALRVPIAQEYREAVLSSLETLFLQGDGLMALELEPEEEAAPQFRPSASDEF